MMSARRSVFAFFVLCFWVLAEKTRPRIAVLGDSFVWDYDVEAEDLFATRFGSRT